MGSSLKSRWLLLTSSVLVLLAVGGVVYLRPRLLPAEATPQAEAVKTATVRRGDLTLVASGNGTLVPSAEVDLGFRTGGTLADMLVEVGDQVKAGDVLARLDDTDAQTQVAQAQINLRLAELQLAKLTGAADPSDLASARASLASANAAFDAILEGPEAEEIASAKADLQLAEIAVQQAQAEYDKIAWRGNVGMTAQAIALQEATIAYEKAQANYDLQVAGPSADQIAAAQANVAQAQAQLDTLLNSASAEDLAIAQLEVDQAQSNLTAAQQALQQTVLTAPFAGTITAVLAESGETVGTAPIVTLADLSHPSLQLYLDEADMALIAPGYEVEVTFDALPDETFQGAVVRVDPVLVTVDNAPAVQALASLDLAPDGNPRFLPAGMNASVDVIAGRAENALLVPLEALREYAPGKFAVFVMVDGKLKMRKVEVGLKDYTSAEIISGLSQGDVVSTGIVETQ